MKEKEFATQSCAAFNGRTRFFSYRRNIILSIRCVTAGNQKQSTARFHTTERPCGKEDVLSIVEWVEPSQSDTTFG